MKTSITLSKCYLPIGKEEKTSIAGFISKLSAVAVQKKQSNVSHRTMAGRSGNMAMDS